MTKENDYVDENNVVRLKLSGDIIIYWNTLETHHLLK